MQNSSKDYVKLLNHKLNQRNKELETVRANADAVLSSIGDGVIVTDENGRILKVNRVALDSLGYKEKEVIGEWFPHIFVARDMNNKKVDLIDRPINQAFLEGKAINAKLFYERKDGSSFPATITVSPIIMDGKPTGAIEVFRDITNEYHMDKMKDDFISIASHQLRTPASGVKQYIGMMLEGYVGDLSKEQLDMLTRAYESNERQLKIIDDLLMVAKVEAGKISLNRQQVNMVDLVKDIMKELNQSFTNARQTVMLSSTAENLVACVDQDRIRMAIENILENASKYTMQKGKIEINLQKNKSNLQIKITDNGVGISAQDRKRLFQKFMRLGNPALHAVSGSGLGLYWAKQIVDLHDGNIHVKSVLGEGSEFTIEIPIGSASTN